MHSAVRTDQLVAERPPILSLVSEPDLVLLGRTADQAIFADITALAARLHEHSHRAVLGEMALKAAVQVALDRIQAQPAA